MANVLRYKRDQPTKRGLKKGNTVVGTGEENYGPSSTTGYVAGITPPAGGYTIYTLSGENDPAIYVAESDNDLPAIARTLGGGELTPLQAKNYLRRRFNTWVLDSVPDNTITDGLKLHLDAKNQSSFINNQPTTNLLAAAGSDPEIERSGTSYPYYSVNIDSLVQSQWSPTNNVMSISFEGKRDYVAGGTGGGNDGYPVFYVYFTDWSWASTLGITSYDWSFNNKTFTMPDPTGKSVRFAIYHMNAGNRGKSYSRKHQIEFQPSYTEFVNGTRNENPIWKDISGNKKPLSELRVLGAHHSGYQYPPFYNFFRINCQMVNEPVVNDLPANWPPEVVAEQFDLVIADEYVWAMGGGVIDWMKECVDLGVSCIGIGNDQRGTTFVSGYNSGTRQAHDIRMDSKSPFGLQGRIFGYGSGDVYGGITALQNGAKPVYYRDDVDRITGYVYENDDTGAAFWFDQEGLQGTDTELFEAGVDYLTKNIGLRWYPTNGPVHSSNGWFDFDGSNDYIDLKEDRIISPDNQGWTAEYWFSTDNATTIQHFNSAENDEFNANWLAIYNSKLAVWNRSPGYWKYGSTTLQNGTWYQAVFVCDAGGTNMRYYINGVREGGDHVGNSWNATYSSLETRYIGRYEYNGSYSRYFNGKMAKIRMYDRALSDSEISQNFHGGNIVTDGLTFATDAGNLVSYQNGSSNTYSLTGSDSGILTNGVGYDSSNGGVFTFDGANEYIRINAGSALGTSQITIAAWVYPTQDATTGGRTRGAVFGGPGALYLGLWPNSSAGSSAIHTAVQTTSGRPSTQTGTIYTNQWSYLLATYDGANFKTYLNGEYVTQTSQTGTISAGSTYYIGTYGALTDGNHNFPGKISCATIYNRSLSEEEILQNYTAQKARFGH